MVMISGLLSPEGPFDEFPESNVVSPDFLALEMSPSTGILASILSS
jgi:hypothetical protein